MVQRELQLRTDNGEWVRSSFDSGNTKLAQAIKYIVGNSLREEVQIDTFVYRFATKRCKTCNQPLPEKKEI